MSNEKPKPMITLRKFSEQSGIPYTSLLRYGKQKKFPLYFFGKAAYVCVSEVNQWIESNRKVSA